MGSPEYFVAKKTEEEIMSDVKFHVKLLSNFAEPLGKCVRKKTSIIRVNAVH